MKYKFKCNAGHEHVVVIKAGTETHLCQTPGCKEIGKKVFIFPNPRLHISRLGMECPL